MVKTILKEVKEYTKASIVTPIFMLLEVLLLIISDFLSQSIQHRQVPYQQV